MVEAPRQREKTATQPDGEEALSLAEKTVKKALQQGADEAEAYVTFTSQTSVGIRNGQLARNAQSKEHGLALRAVKAKALGFAFTNTLEKAKVEAVVGKALAIAEANKPDINWPGFSVETRFRPPIGTFDRRLVGFPSEELVRLASLMLESAINRDKRVLAVQGRVGVAYESNAIANSNGVAACEEGTAIACGVATIARDGAQLTPVCFDFAVERTCKLEPSQVGAEAAMQAVSMLNAKPVKSGTYPVVFTTLAFQDLLSYTFMEAIKADRVQREQSMLKGKIGEKIASGQVTMHDDGLLAGGLQTSKFDGEGTPKQKTPIIEKGVLQHFLYDRYTAKKDETRSTGNSSRRAYMATPIISPSNFVLEAGMKTPQTLLSEIEDGLIVYYLQGGQSSNPLTGEFSVIATPAWKIEKGEVAYPIREVMLADTVFEILKNVSALANNTRKLEYLVAPWVRVENVRTVGR